MGRLFILITIGAVLGAGLGYYGKCSSGVCPLTSTPIRGAIYGAVLAFLFVMLTHVYPN